MKLLGPLDWIVLVITVFVLLYLYATRKKNYWKNQNVVYEKLSLIFGPASRILFHPLHETDEKRYKKHGKLFGIFEGGKPSLVVAEPDLVKLILVKDFQALPNRRPIKLFDPLLDNMMNIAQVEQWRKIRPSASPAFSTGKLRKMNALIEDCAKVTAEHLKKAAKNNEDVDIKQFYGHYSLDVIARCAFGTRLDSHTDVTNEFVTRARKAFSGVITLPMILFALFPAIFNWLKIKPFNSDTFVYFKNVCQNIIKNRQQESNRQEDFLQLMMDAQQTGIATAATENVQETDTQLFNLDSEVKPDSSFSVKALTEDEAMAQCVLFFLAGQDTTSSVIAHAMYMLALNPEIQAKLREEADECFATHGKEPPLDVISKLPYIHGVVSEALRMFPPAPRIERSAIEDYVLGDTKIKIPKGCVIAVPVFAMHYDPEYFPDPHAFVPERFSTENVASIRPYTYLPFGAGPRNCIGMRFALQAVKLCILHSVHSVEFVRTEKTKVPLEFCKGFGILNAKDVTVGIRERSQ